MGNQVFVYFGDCSASGSVVSQSLVGRRPCPYAKYRVSTVPYYARIWKIRMVINCIFPSDFLFGLIVLWVAWTEELEELDNAMDAKDDETMSRVRTFFVHASETEIERKWVGNKSKTGKNDGGQRNVMFPSTLMLSLSLFTRELSPANDQLPVWSSRRKYLRVFL